MSPSDDVNITFRLPREVHTAAKELAEAEHRSLSNLLLVLVIEGLERRQVDS